MNVLLPGYLHLNLLVVMCEQMCTIKHALCGLLWSFINQYSVGSLSVFVLILNANLTD